MATSGQDLRLALVGDVSHCQIDLAHENSFWLGAVLVEPSRLRLSRQGAEDLTVEPRVMQVLSALFEAHGNVVGRDDLIERCWAGRIVGENSINRVISLLRRAAERIGMDSFEIETIPKVGYRLNSASMMPANDPAMPSPVPAEDGVGGMAMTRRRMIGGLAAAGVGGLAAAGATMNAPTTFTALRDGSFTLFGGHVPTQEARELYDAGRHAQLLGLGSAMQQAEIYFRRAAQADPEWPQAWGSMAMSYLLMMDEETSDENWRLVEQARSAANRALELDPANASALATLVMIQPTLGRWREAEHEYAAFLERFPDAFFMRDYYAHLLMDLGRYAEAVKHTRQNIANEPLAPCASVPHLQSLWGAGRLQEADAELERAVRLFGNSPFIWFARVEYLTYTGRAAEAVGFASDRRSWSNEVPHLLFERRLQTAQAVLTRSPKDIDTVMSALGVYIQRCFSSYPFRISPWWCVSMLSELGDFDTAFDILESYYFWRGRLAPPKQGSRGPLTRRPTEVLFSPVLKNLRRDARFAPLVEEIGLTSVFRSAGKWPDRWRRA